MLMVFASTPLRPAPLPPAAVFTFTLEYICVKLVAQSWKSGKSSDDPASEIGLEVAVKVAGRTGSPDALEDELEDELETEVEEVEVEAPEAIMVLVMVSVLVVVDVIVVVLLPDEPTTYPPPTATMATIITTPATSAELNPCLLLNFIYGTHALDSRFMACRKVLLCNIAIYVIYGSSIFHCAGREFFAQF
jgi:hypothetical protein